MNVLFADGRRVDVADAQCEHRPCFALGFDKGVYVQGRGYTHYHPQPLAVCWTRHRNGCPVVAARLACDACGALVRSVPLVEPRLPGPAVCPGCGSDRLSWHSDVLPNPVPCCEAPGVARSRKEPPPYRQRCKGCGKWLQGWRLRHARGEKAK